MSQSERVDSARASAAAPGLTTILRLSPSPGLCRRCAQFNRRRRRPASRSCRLCERRRSAHRVCGSITSSQCSINQISRHMGGERMQVSRGHSRAVRRSRDCRPALGSNEFVCVRARERVALQILEQLALSLLQFRPSWRGQSRASRPGPSLGFALVARHGQCANGASIVSRRRLDAIRPAGRLMEPTPLGTTIRHRHGICAGGRRQIRRCARWGRAVVSCPSSFASS